MSLTDPANHGSDLDKSITARTQVTGYSIDIFITKINATLLSDKTIAL
jgi:hypothetical protein